jgi:hypothetical protein
MQLNREAILGLQDLPKKEVPIPEWNGSVYVRALTGRERDTLERMIQRDDVSRAAIVALVTVDEHGKRLFTDEDVSALGEKSGAALEKIVGAALSFNMLTEESMESGKAD